LKILVTGGAGFIGSHTVDLLVKEGYSPIVVDCNENGFKNPKAHYYIADITTPGLLETIFTNHKPAAVIHLAAQVSVETSMMNPILDVNVNVLGTILLLEQCRIHQAKMIFASSAAIYGLPQTLPIPETHRADPISIYGLSKLTVENYIQLYHKQFGVNYCILRYSNVYGPRQGHTGEGGVISIFLEKLTKEQTPVIFGNGEQTRDFIYVEDVAHANLHALRDGDNQIFNVATMTELSINKLVENMLHLLNSPIKPLKQPAKKGDITRSILDTTAINTSNKWSPVVGITYGLTATIRYFNDSKNL
jgi:UDP-glucose 4-epimerase